MKSIKLLRINYFSALNDVIAAVQNGILEYSVFLQQGSKHFMLSSVFQRMIELRYNFKEKWKMGRNKKQKYICVLLVEGINNFQKLPCKTHYRAETYSALEWELPSLLKYTFHFHHGLAKLKIPSVLKNEFLILPQKTENI